MLQRQRRVREAQAAAPDALPAARPHAQSIVDRPQAEGSRQAGGGVARHRPQDDIASLKMTSLARLISHVSVSIAFYSWHMNRRKVVCTDLRFQSWVSFCLTVFRVCSCARRPLRHSAAVSEFTGKCDFFRFCKELAPQRTAAAGSCRRHARTRGPLCCLRERRGEAERCAGV